MEIVSQKVSTGVSSVPIKHSEEAALRPVGHVFFGGWLHDVEDYAHSVFIIVSDDALVSIGGIPHDVTIFANTALSGLPARQIESLGVGWWTLA